MNEEEKEAIERLKEIATNTYAEGKARVIDTILNLIEKLQKENKKLKKSKITYEDVRDIQEKNKNIVDKKYISKQKVREKIEEMQKEYNKLDEEVDKYINDANKDLAKYYEYKEKISIMQTLSCFIDTLQELLEGRK